MASVAATAPSSRNPGTIEVNGTSYILGGVKESNFLHAEERQGGSELPAFDGDVAAFAQSNDSSQLYNSVKKCSVCEKVCAASVSECNGCGASLANTQVSQSNNVFMGFVHGIAKGPFPFKVGIRHESEDLLVFDDPLAITRAHVCAIPTDVYIPDVRHLFTNPKLALPLLQKMSNAAWEATERHFLDNEAWATKALSPEARALDRETLRGHVLAGFNLPPSQFQLHLQHMLLPMTPFHYGMFRAGKHATYGRFIPLIWVEQALASLAANNQRVDDAAEMEGARLFAAVKTLTDIDYDTIHAAEYERYVSSHKLFANYSVDDFEYALPEADSSAPPLKLATLLSEGKEEPVEGVSRKQVDDQDKQALQSYGRPYDENGKPTGRYYAYTRPSPLPIFPFGTN